jgi:uncharacterized membrane protein YfcA
MEWAWGGLTAAFAGVGFWPAAAATLVAGLMRGFAGFGSAMLMAPLFAIFFGSADMVLTVVAMEMAVSFQLFPKVRKDATWRLIGPMSVASCVAMPFGIWLLVNVDKTLIVKAVSGIVLAFVIVLALGFRFRARREPIGASIVGAISGAMMATTSVGGPPVLLYLLSGDDPAKTHRANIISYYFITSFLLIALVLATGVAGWPALVRAAVLTPVLLLGSMVGTRMFDPGNEKVYRRVTLAILGAVGIFGLLK